MEDTFTGAPGNLTGHTPEAPAATAWTLPAGSIHLQLTGSSQVEQTSGVGAILQQLPVPNLGTSLAAGFTVTFRVDMGTVADVSWTVSIAGGALVITVAFDGTNIEYDGETTADSDSATFPATAGFHDVEATYDGATGWQFLFDDVLLFTLTDTFVPTEDALNLIGQSITSVPDMLFTDLLITA